jgi:hypothetical protein
VPPSPLPCVLVTLAFPALSRSLPLCVLTWPYARLLCCSFVFYLPRLRAQFSSPSLVTSSPPFPSPLSPISSRLSQLTLSLDPADPCYLPTAS